ncbi:substrate-binding domain-containing protein, partial [Acinetobacter baumannii]
ISNDWASKFPNHAAPFSSSSVFIVRKGNPKQIRDWPDLIKADVQVVIPNPKLSGNGRYTYVSAWGWALRQSGGNATTAE